MKMQTLEGKLLVASPQLDDPQFSETVVLVLHHDEGGAFGVVLNRPIGETVQDIWEALGEEPCENELRVSDGGPESGTVMAIHGDESFADLRVLPGVYLAVQKDNLDWLVRHSDRPYRVFVGCAGWAAGQLDDEFASGAWLSLPADGEDVFTQTDDLWASAVREIGHGFYADVLGIQRIPEDATMN